MELGLLGKEGHFLKVKELKQLEISTTAYNTPRWQIYGGSHPDPFCVTWKWRPKASFDFLKMASVLQDGRMWPYNTDSIASPFGLYYSSY